MADYLSGLPDIPFAYNSALAAARSLASLAEATRSTATNRRGITNNALITWEGDFRAEFIRRTDDEIAALEAAAGELDVGAEKWAVAWRDAMYENNMRRRGRKVKEISDNRGGWSKAWDSGPGSDDSNDKVAQARQPSLPQSPNFYSNDSPQRFA